MPSRMREANSPSAARARAAQVLACFEATREARTARPCQSVRHELVCTAEDLREPSPQTPRRRRHRFMNVTHTNVHTSHELDHTVGTLSTIID